MVLFKSKYTVLIIVVTVNLLATTGDITIAWTSPIFPKLYSNDTSINPLGKPITIKEDTILSSILNVGAVIGPLPFNFLANRFGYKITLLCLAVPHIIAFFILAFAKHIYTYYLARVLSGLSLGAGYSLYGMYAGEISDGPRRGAMVVITNVFWSIGNFIPLAIGPYLSILQFNLILVCLPITSFVIFLVIGVDSPFQLIYKEKVKEAEKTLVYLRGSDNETVQHELKRIKFFVETTEDGQVSHLFTDRHLRRFVIICIILLITQDLGGYCSILYHLHLIFQAADLDISANIAAIIVGICIVISSFTAPFLVDHYGRRPLLIISAGGMCVSLALLGTFYYLLNNGYNTDFAKYLPLFTLMSYITSYNLGINTVPWTLVSELFPNSLKQAVFTIIAMCCWIVTLVVTFSYNTLNDLIGSHGTLWLFSGWCLWAFIFAVIYAPETKGKSFSEIQEIFYPE